MVRVSPTYVEQSYADMATPNVVTAVLADYRSLDTLIETAVVLAAALACLLIMMHRDDPTA
jgi:multicomponent Na+:H+ antiporter subunit B